MDKETLNKRIEVGNFIKNNGAVLRAINMLGVKYNKLQELSYATYIDKSDFEISADYLYESGYIHMRHINTEKPTSLADTRFDMIEAKLTQKGKQLIAGVIRDECVEV